MAAPTVPQVISTAYNTATSPKVTASMNVLAGDLLVAICETEDNGSPATISDNTGAALTWTQESPVAVASFGWVAMWTAPITADRTGLTVTFTRGATSVRFGGSVFTVRGHGGKGVYAKTNSTGAPSVNLTTTAANSLVIVANVDWNAVDGAVRTWRANAGALTEAVYNFGSGIVTFYAGRHADTGPRGTYSLGLSAPTGQKFSLAALEVLPAASSTTYDRSGATVSAVAPAASVARTRERLRSGSTVTASAPAASVIRVNPVTHTGTVAVGRVQPVRAGTTAVSSQPSGSRTVSTATRYTRGGSTVSAMSPSASRTVLPTGITYSRAATVAVGRVPTVRSGGTQVATGLSGSRIVGTPGAMFDRGGLVVTGRIAKSRSGGTVSAQQPSGSRAVTPAGVVDRTGGTGGGAGRSQGLLLTLQAHPGVTFSGSRLIASNIPLRTATVASRATPSASRATQRDRSAIVAVTLVLAGTRTQSGNRNRNGLIRSDYSPSGSVSLIRLAQRSATLTARPTLTGSAGVGVTPVYVRASAITGRTVLSGRVTVRHLSTRTYIWAPITTGYIAQPNEEGVVVA